MIKFIIHPCLIVIACLSISDALRAMTSLSVAADSSAPIGIVTTMSIFVEEASTERAKQAQTLAILELLLANNMVCIEGGTYVMGCTEANGDCWANELPTHSTTIKGFYLAKFEVTQAVWQSVMGTNPSKFNTCAECPVESVSWDEVQTFIQRLNQATGKNYRLPTEAEWEYAAREGGKNVLFGNGANVATSESINFNAQSAIKKDYVVSGQFRQATAPVGMLQPNALGLYDMSGNVWEWCSDQFQAYCASEATPNTVQMVTANAPSNQRTMRGGSWKNPAQFCRTTARGKESQNKGNMFIGFRLAMDK
jgi:formylglycine-generating enzyme